MPRRFGNWARALVFVIGFCFGSPALAQSLRLEIGTFDPLREAPPVSQDLIATGAPSGLAPWIVQFDQPTRLANSQDLESSGAIVHGYVPDFAYLVTATVETANRLRDLAGVRWVGPWEPGFRLSPAIGTIAFRNPERAASDRLTLVVRLFDDPATAAQRFETAGMRVLETIENTHEAIVVVEADREHLDDLAFDPLTWYVHEKPETVLWNNTTKWVVQSNQSGLTPIWDQGLTGTGEIVTLMDSGVDYNSCFFREAGNSPPGPGHRKVIDYTTFGGNVYDGCGTGHGTHVAGTIAGDQSYINGSTDHAGMAFDAKLTVQDVGQDGFLDCLFGFVNVPTTLTAAFNASYALDARIHSNSWGSSSNTYDTHAANVDQFMWDHPDFLILFANGNAGPGASTVGTPGTAKNLISVGATQQAPNQNTIASYSSRGPAFDSRIKPTVVAPGGDSNGYINSANNATGNPPGATCATQGSPFAGTSMATPAVAGMAALTRQYFRDGFYPQGSASGTGFAPSAALVKATLVNAAHDAGTADIPNNNEGFGRILLDGALYFDGDTRELRIEEDGGVATGETRTFQYEIDSSGEPFEVVLVWTDYPGTQGAGVALVNDLDLRVTAPGGQVYLGNVFSGGASTTGGSADRRNVEEVVRFDAPATGTYQVAVVGFNVPQAGAQPFALASTAAFGNWPSTPASVDAPLASQNGWHILAAEPNPTTAETRIALRVPETATRARIGIYDVSGSLVRKLADDRLPAGLQHLRWDGRDESGRIAVPGVYFMRVEAGATILSTKLVVAR